MVAAPLLYLAVGLGLLVASDRWLRPLGRGVAAALLLLPLIFVGEAWITGRAWGPLDMPLGVEPLSASEAARDHRQGDGIRNTLSADLPFQILPWHAAVRGAWKGGEWPLWNPSMMGGDALAATAQSAPFHPVNLLALALPLHQILAFHAACTLLLAALGGFLYARELHVPEPAALLGAVAFALSGFLVSWLGWPMALAAAHLPWVFLAVRRWVATKTGDLLPWLLALVLASALLAGHPETVAHLVVAGGLYGLSEMALSRGKPTPWAWALRKTGGAAAAGILAAALSAVSLLPILDALPQTAQFEGRQQAFAGADHSVPAREAFGRARTAAIPFVFGLPWSESAPTGAFFVPTSSAYIGSTLFGLTLLGLLAHPWPGRFWMGAFALFGIAAGASAPGVTDLLSRLPLVDLSIHKRWVLLAAFALSTLASLGAQVAFFPRSLPRRVQRVPPARALVAGHLIGLAGVVTLLALSWNRLTTSDFSNRFLFVHCALLLGPLLVTTAWSIRPQAGSRHGAEGAPGKAILFFLALLLAQRAGEVGDRFPNLDPDSIYPPLPLLEQIPKDGAPARFVAAGDLLPPNLGAPYGLEDVRGYQPMALGSYVRTFGLWTSGGDAYFHRVDDLERPFLDLLGVRWALDPEGAAVPEGWTAQASWRGYRLLQNHRALPRAFLPRQIGVGDAGRARFTRLVNGLPEPGLNPNRSLRPSADREQPDAARLAFLEPWQSDLWGIDDGASTLPSTGETGGGSALHDNGRGRLEVRREGLGLRIGARLDDPAWIVVTEPAWRGWRAEVTAGPWVGRRLPVLRANLTFLAVRLPAGEHELSLDYRPGSFHLGLAMTVGAILVALSAGVRSRLRRRRGIPGRAGPGEGS